MKQHWKKMVEIPQEHYFLTWNIQNFVRQVKQFVRKYYITWLIDLANKLYDYDLYYLKLSCFIKKFCYLLNKFQFNSLYINMWLSSLNIFSRKSVLWDKKMAVMSQFADMTSWSFFYDVVMFFMSSLVTGPSFKSISLVSISLLELWQFLFIIDWPEFCPRYGDWDK